MLVPAEEEEVAALTALEEVTAFEVVGAVEWGLVTLVLALLLPREGAGATAAFF